MTKRFTALTLFSGGGGADIGIKLGGGDIRAAIDFSPWAARTYRANDPTTPFVQCDVRDLSQCDRAARDFLHSVGIGPGSLGYVHASPPCQPFSRGRSKGIGEANRISVHSGVLQSSAATLPLDVARFVHQCRPMTGTMENVTGLITRYPIYFERILDEIRYCGGVRSYYCHYKILRADEYGVAQTRPRLFLIFIRNDVAERVGIWSDRAVLNMFPKPTHLLPVSIRASFEGLQQTQADELPFYRSIRLSRLPELLRKLPPRPLKRIRLKNVDSYFTLVRCSWDHPAPTLVIAGQKPDGLSGAIHPELDRKFTIPELKRLFSLPDDFILSGPVTQAVDTICNMIPPPVQQAIVSSISRLVLDPYGRSSG